MTSRKYKKAARAARQAKQSEPEKTKQREKRSERRKAKQARKAAANSGAVAASGEHHAKQTQLSADQIAARKAKFAAKKLRRQMRKMGKHSPVAASEQRVRSRRESRQGDK